MARQDSFNQDVALPPGLEISAIRRAIDFAEERLTELVDIYYEQANIFSAVVGIMGAKALDSFSIYEKHRNIDTAQQRFPDLKKRGSGQNPRPEHCLESKGSKRPWALQSHYDHAGWYVVWRYLVDETLSLDPERPVIIWRVDIVFLEKGDWKYESSTASAKGGGRTHTFGVKRPATKLKGMAVYQRKDVMVRDGKAIPGNGD